MVVKFVDVTKYSLKQLIHYALSNNHLYNNAKTLLALGSVNIIE